MDKYSRSNTIPNSTSSQTNEMDPDSNSISDPANVEPETEYITPEDMEKEMRQQITAYNEAVKALKKAASERDQGTCRQSLKIIISTRNRFLKLSEAFRKTISKEVEPQTAYLIPARKKIKEAFQKVEKNILVIEERLEPQLFKAVDAWMEKPDPPEESYVRIADKFSCLRIDY